MGYLSSVPYFLPKIRWWESDPRNKLLIPAKVRLSSDALIQESDILDISLMGCFVRTRETVPENERVQIEFSVFGHDFVCSGIVVWRAESTVTHPKGLGIKFTPPANIS